jgi:hypothetical protein
MSDLEDKRSLISRRPVENLEGDECSILDGMARNFSTDGEN